MSNKSNNHKVIWWLSMSIVAIVLVAGLSLTFCQSCKEIVGEGVKQIKEMVNPVLPPSNHYAEFLTLLKGEKEDCPEPSSSTDKPSPPLTAECGELRKLQSEREIAVAVNDLQNFKSKGNLSVSLMFVRDRRERDWLEKYFTDFASVSDLSDIVAKRDILRKLFGTFQTVADNSNALDTYCRLDSKKFPYLALACRVAEEAKKTTTQPLQKPEWETLPFFSKNDVLRVQSFSKVADKAEELKAIESNSDVTVLNKLCLLAKKKENIQSGIAYEMMEGKVDDADVEKMAKAVLKFVGEVKTICQVSLRENS